MTDLGAQTKPVNSHVAALAGHQITKTFGPVTDLENVNFEAHYGRVLALLGDNGAGKTTLIKLLSGVLQPDGGELVMDGEVTIELVKLDTPAVPADKEGSVRIDGEPVGKKMGRIVLRKGHQALLPANSAYRMSASAPSVVLLQTILGDDTIERWAEICLS